MHKIKVEIKYPPIDNWGKVEAEIKKLGNASVLVWLFDRLMAGRLSDGQLIWSQEVNDVKENIRLLKELRAFNQNCELKIWSSVSGIKGRLVEDVESGDETFVKDANMALWGTTGVTDNDFTILTEERGTQVIIPGNYPIKDREKKRVVAKVRHYIDFFGPENALAGYKDYRFVDFKMVEL